MEKSYIFLTVTVNCYFFFFTNVSLTAVYGSTISLYLRFKGKLKFEVGNYKNLSDFLKVK